MDNFLLQIKLGFAAVRHHKLITAVIKAYLAPDWWHLLLFFSICSLVMITRLRAIEKNGFEGTLIGTLIMPYCSGFPNICFAWLMFKKSGGGLQVLENCLVNNITNLTLVLGIPSLLWGLNLFRPSQQKSEHEKLHHLSLLLSLFALIFFSACLFFLSKDGVISRNDGMLLVLIFLFWQVFHLFEVLKNNIVKQRRIKKRIVFDLAIIGLCAWGIFSSTDQLIQWVFRNGSGFFSTANLGFLSGVFMVLPNAFMAVYYAAFRRSEIAYSSQIGDCHICIPLCIGLFAVFAPISMTTSFQTALFVLMGAAAGHFLFTAVFGRLPRPVGFVFICLYAFFIYKKII